MKTIVYQEIREKLLAGEEVAIVDLREEHIFAQNHPLFATNISLSRLEIEIYNRIPRLNTLTVIYDDGDGRVERAYKKLSEYGYSNIAVLEGGVEAWQRDGGELFIDVNSASKAFGEFVEHHKGTPSLSAEELKAKIDAQENIVILDARRFDEYQTMSIPTGMSVPGAELVLRAPSLVKDENTQIIVNCAGRTRSIIGTQSLINAKLPHEIFALRNGTIGWTLAGQQLEHGQQRSFVALDTQIDEQAKQNAEELAKQAGVKQISLTDLQDLQAQEDKTTYIFDVRTEQEYAAGHLPGSRWVAGGQLVQETDHYAAVRGACIVLVDDQLVRAYMTGSWLAQMNWDVYVLEDDFVKLLAEAGGWKPATPQIDVDLFISPEELQQLSATQNIAIWDFTTAANYKKGHIPNAQWVLKADVAKLIQQSEFTNKDAIVVTCGSSLLAQYAVPEIKAQLNSNQKVYILKGGNAAWVQTGLPLEQELDLLSEEIDRYKRPYEGTDNSREAMQSYLDWEFGLVDQLKNDGTHGFFVI
ncbi:MULTISPECIES: rhodanese-like domain-containing protein [unclassified Acinetobacter]|uniref:rhodanese-like domain-containing protein n=1 Tax=unclassified Acinetobacter TaxID=196816 RepID=UPI0015D27AF6|nr:MULTISPECIES: rhodanese-like domain-containing protein [unclassified Acinetobacter]UUS59089.1 rhodanese-related sulfurtransferase [Acinetobacter sp. YH16040_T]HRO78754.1 rhodanese-like domain-containing protein [Acinetobacter towneri]